MKQNLEYNIILQFLITIIFLQFKKIIIKINIQFFWLEIANASISQRRYASYRRRKRKGI